MSLPFTSYKNFMINRHGDSLYRIPIDFNFGCPNREKDGSGGCTFCNVRGSAAVQTIGSSSVKEQMKTAINFSKKRYNAKKFMAYVQAYSATFGESQQPLYLELINSFPFSAVSIGTRPDCITPQALEFLELLNKKIEVWVELGVQTIHDHTLDRINRGHDWKSSIDAIKKLNSINIPIALHAIIGLPGETKEDYKETAKAFSKLPIQAVKIHNLHIEKGTTLALENTINPVKVLDEYEFGDQLIEFIRRLPPNLPIMRFTTDTPKDELIAPKWNMDKQQFKNYIVYQMECREVRQGDLFFGKKDIKPIKDIKLKSVKTNDDSITFWNPLFKEHYHSMLGGRLEAMEKYIFPSELSKLTKLKNIRILDICFGLGYNSLSAINSMYGYEKKIKITALEIDKRVVRHAFEKIQNHINDNFNWKKTLKDLYTYGFSSPTKNSQLNLILGDARYSIQKLPNNYYDIVFLDAFSSQKNSELWSIEFLKLIYEKTHKSGKLLTYSSSGPVRSSMISSGFKIGRTLSSNKEGTLAVKKNELLKYPIVNDELKKLLSSTKGIPFRDPSLTNSNKEILRRREKELLKFKEKIN